jgi:hypothetical protein
MNFVEAFKQIWKFISFKSENSPGLICYAHPAPSPRIYTEGLIGGARESTGPTGGGFDR